MSKKKESLSTFTFFKYGIFVIWYVKDHTHGPIEPIECEVMQVLREINKFITAHPEVSD